MLLRSSVSQINKDTVHDADHNACVIAKFCHNDYLRWFHQPYLPPVMADETLIQEL